MYVYDSDIMCRKLYMYMIAHYLLAAERKVDVPASDRAAADHLLCCVDRDGWAFSKDRIDPTESTTPNAEYIVPVDHYCGSVSKISWTASVGWNLRYVRRYCCFLTSLCVSNQPKRVSRSDVAMTSQRRHSASQSRRFHVVVI